jgi:hypothetical protein
MLSLLGVLPALAPQPAQPPDAAAALPGLTRGELLCQAFEAYRTLVPTAQISFEHAVFLATALTRGDQLRLAGCARCGSLMVTERYPARIPRCHHCAVPAQAH